MYINIIYNIKYNINYVILSPDEFCQYLIIAKILRAKVN